MKQTIYFLALLLGLTAPTSIIVAQTDLDSALVVTTIEGEEEDTTSSNTWTFNNGSSAQVKGYVSVNDSTVTEYEYDDLDDFLNDLTDGHAKGIRRMFRSLEKFGWVFVLLPILFFFVFPLLILFLILFFVYKGNKSKQKTYQKLIDSGQPIPQETVNRMTQESQRLRNEGLRDICVGIGLAIFLGIIIDEVGIGIGALVAFIGLGKLMAWYANNKDKQKAKSEGSYDKDMTRSEGSYDKNVAKSEGNYDKDIKQ